MGNSLWQLVWQADSMSKLVLLILLVISIVCWTLFVYKIVMFRIKRRHMKEAIKRLDNVHDLEGLLSVAAAFAGTVPGYIFSKNLSFLKALLQRRSEKSDVQYGWELMQQYMYQMVDTVVINEEAYLPVLSTSAAVSPLLGLFGTIWGLVHSFIRISERQTADITTVAPGIAEALITTLAGLLVAIPALVLVNYLYTYVREMERLANRLTDRMGLIVQTILLG